MECVVVKFASLILYAIIILSYSYVNVLEGRFGKVTRCRNGSKGSNVYGYHSPLRYHYLDPATKLIFVKVHN